ncbi:alpha/beta fold hydrolase [Streptosporangium sp. G12]
MYPAKVESLKLPGARLHYEVRGSGPVLLMIPAGPMDAEAFAEVAGLLAGRYTVVTYDTRGNSRSVFDGPPEDCSVADHADDAHHLLAALGSEPAYVFGTSSGALIGLDLVAAHPGQVRALVAHEPPVTELLDEAEHHRAEGRRIHETFLAEGADAALASMIRSGEMDGDREEPEGPGPEGEPGPGTPETTARIRKNVEFYFAHQWLPLIGHLPDIAGLRTAPTRIVVAGGVESREQVAGRAAAALAGRLGTTVVDFPGDHGGGLADRPAEFAERLHSVLAGGEERYAARGSSGPS